MDHALGHGWRWVTDGALSTQVPAGMRWLNLSQQPESEGVVAIWMQRHGVHGALVRPDHYVYGSAKTEQEALQLFENWQQHQQ
jgi:3-(3-hydroxy-phenyl)propionate hydroxylase